MISCREPVRPFLFSIFGTTLRTRGHKHPQTGDDMTKHQGRHNKDEETLEPDTNSHELPYIFQDLALFFGNLKDS